MKFQNQITITGITGQNRLQSVNGRQYARFCVVTQYAYQDANKCLICDVEWHNVVAYEKENTKDALNLKKGDAVKVTGRIRTVRYTDKDGQEKSVKEIIAETVENLGATTLQLEEELTYSPR